MQNKTPDFVLADHGSIAVLTPTSDIAREWTTKYLSDETQWFGRGFVVEHRYVDDIVERLREIDMVVSPVYH